MDCGLQKNYREVFEFNGAEKTDYYSEDLQSVDGENYGITSYFDSLPLEVILNEYLIRLSVRRLFVIFPFHFHFFANPQKSSSLKYLRI